MLRPRGRVTCRFEDSDVVRSAIRVEGFRDDEFNYQLIRALGVADYGGSTVGECLADRGRDHRRQSPELGGRVRAAWRNGSRSGGEPAWPAGIRSAGATICCGRRPTTARPSTTQRGTRPARPGRGAEPGLLRRRRRRCSIHRSSGSRCPSRVDGSRVSGRPAADGAEAARSSHPDRGRRVRLERRGALLPPRGAGSRARWNVFVFDGPGQPGCMRATPSMTFRPDYEVPIGRGHRPPRGPSRCRLRASGLGRRELRLVLRGPGAASDQRVRALVANPPVVDMSRYMEAWVGTDVYRMARDIRPEDVIGVPEDLMPRQMQWGIAAICHRFGVPSFHAWRDAMEQYRLGDRLGGHPRAPPWRWSATAKGAEPAAQFDTFVDGSRRTSRRRWSSARRRCVDPLPVRQPAPVRPRSPSTGWTASSAEPQPSPPSHRRPRF